MKRRLLVFASVLLAALLLVSCGKAYKVNFDLDGGQLEGIAETVEVKKGAKVEHPGDPTKDGHEFEGWFLDDAEYDFDAKVEADLDLKAQWKKVDGEEPEPGEYKVVFDVNHPDGPHVKAQIVTEGQKAVEPAAPVIPYHKFLGWYLGNAKFNFNRAIQQDFILEARWEALTVHEIVYEGVEDTDFGYADKEDMIDAFFKDFYAYMTPENVTYEQFVHAVPGDFNGFWKNYANDKKLYSGAIANLNKLDGSTFATHEVYGPKWFSFFDFLNDWVNGVNTAQFFWTAGGSAVSTGVTRLQQYAVGTLPSGWPAHVYNEYMIQMPEELVKFKPVKLYVEGEGTELPVPTKYPFAFEGWYDNSDFAGDRIESLDADAKGAKTLYAKWRELEEFTVTVTLNYDGAKAIDPEVVNETDLAARPATPARDNHIFDGWTSDAKGEVPYNFSAPVMGNTVIYAKWLEAVFVTYDYDTEDVEDVEVKMVKDTKPAQPANPTKPGFKFEGWFDGEEEFDFGEKLDKDVTLVAKWEELEEYTIEYVFNDGEMMTAFADRDEMVVAFLTDYYNFISGYPDVYDTSKNTLEEFIGDTGKPNDISVPTAPKYKYDGNFNTAMALLTQQDMSVDLESRYFVAQLEYNKWRPLIEAMETFTHVGNPDQHIWGVAEFRVKPFIGMLDLWRYHDAPTTKIIKDAMELIPQQYLEPITKYDEQSEFPLPFPVMDSAEFLGWYDNEDFTGEPIFAIEPGTEGNLKLYAKWNKLDVVKATYHYDEGQFETVIILKNNLLDEPADPVKNLHQFKGWYLNAEFTGDLFDFDTELTKNIDLYAKWEKQPTVFVEFDPNNDDEKVEVEILKDSLASMPETPIKDGFEFMGWYDGETKFDFEEEVTKDVELVAKWQEILSVVHHYDGGAFGAENMINLLESVHVVAPRYAAGADPTGESYSISTTKSVWWYALAFKETGVPMVYELMGKQGANKDPEGFDPKDKDIAFYVQYHDGLKGNFVSQIKQIYTDIKVGDLLVIPNLPAEMESANDKSINLHYFYEFKLDDQYPVRFDYFEDLITPFKEGFLFDGWYSDEAKTEKVEELPESISKNLDLYAKWIEIPAYAITLDQNYNAPVAAKAELTEDKKIDANKDYYTRVASEAGIGKLNDGTYVYTKVAEPVEVDLNKYYELINLGSDSEPVIDIVNQYQDLALEMPKTPLRKGYLFTHWLLDGELYDFNTPITKDLTLVAGWYKLETFDVTFMVDGEEYEVVPTEEYAAVVLPASPTKAGNIFEGWLLDGELYDAKAPVEGDLELVASWLGSVKVTYKLYDGMEITVEVVKGQKLEKPAEPLRKDYQFEGWFVGEDEFDFDTLITENITIVADWTEVPVYNITYEPNGGKLGQAKMFEEFLIDFYAFVSPEESIEDFMHGVENTSGNDGTWHSKHKALIYAGNRPEEINNDYFISHENYMDKWAPFFDTVHDFIVAVNPDQYFFGVSTEVGLIRLRQYVAGIKPANWVPQSMMDMVPEEYNLELVYKYDFFSDAIEFQAPAKARHDFLGWYDNPEFEGNPIAKLNPNADKDINLYAKWSEEYYRIIYVDDDAVYPCSFSTREEMIDAFLKDFYDHLIAIEKLNTDLHATFAEFKDWYHKDENDDLYVKYLVTADTDFTVNPNSDIFISQAKYNGWVPLIKLMNEYTTTTNSTQTFYKVGDGSVGGNGVAYARIKRFMIQHRYNANAAAVAARIPNEYIIPYRYNSEVNLWVVEKEGEVFVGWFDNAELTGEPITSIDVAIHGDIVLYVGWESSFIEYTVTFKLDNDDANPVEVKYYQGNEIIKPETPVREGFLFDKWLLDGEAYDFSNPIEANLELIGSWNESVVITHELENNEDDLVVEIVKGTKYAKPKDPVKKGYTFEGWELEGEAYDFNEEVTEAITLVATWEELMKVEFNLDGGKLSSLITQDFVIATRYSNAGDNTGNPITIGHGRGGLYWYVMAFKETEMPGMYELLGKGGGYTNEAADLYISYHDAVTGDYAPKIKQVYGKIVVGDLVFVEKLPAAVSANTIVEISFVYQAEALNVDKNTFYYKDLAELPNALKANYVFDGWYSDAALTTKVETLPETLEENLTLYPKWKESVKIIYDFSDLEGKGAALEAAELEAILADANLVSIDKAEKIYDGNGDGGTYPQTSGLLKFGTGSVKGELHLTLAEGVLIQTVVIYAEGWTATDKMSVNGVENDLTLTYGDRLVFVLDEPTNEIEIETNNRAFVFGIELLGVGIVAEATEYVTVTAYPGFEDKDPEVVTFRKGLVAPIKNPLRSGHLFKGWLLDGTLFDLTLPVEKNVIISAFWEELIIEYVDDAIVNYDFVGLDGDAKEKQEPFWTDLFENEHFEEVTHVSKAYAGNGNGGGIYEQNRELIKFGTSSANGELTLKFKDEVRFKTIILHLDGWTASDKVIVNGQEFDLAVNADVEEPAAQIEVILESPTSIIEIVVQKRGFLLGIDLYGADAELPQP